MQDWKAKLAQTQKALAQHEKQRSEVAAEQAAEYRRRLNQELDQAGKDMVLFAESQGVDCEWRIQHKDPQRFGFTFRIPAAGAEFSLTYPEQAGAPEWQAAALTARLGAIVRAAGEASRAANRKLRKK